MNNRYGEQARSHLALTRIRIPPMRTLLFSSQTYDRDSFLAAALPPGV